MRTIRFLLRKEFLQIGRDRAMLRMLLLMPIVQLLILSNAATFELNRSETWLIDQDHTTTSRALVRKFTASGLFVFVNASGSMEGANNALLDREISTILQIPAGLERDLLREGSAAVALTFNAEDGAAASIRRSYAMQILGSYNREISSVPQGRIEVATHGWYNPVMEYQDYMVPGILVVLVTIIATTIGAMNIVREKELGTLEQLNVTPITRGQFIAAKLIPFWIIAMASLGAGLIVARLVFDIPMRGNLLLVFGSASIYLLVALGIGLWISTIAATQQQAMFISFGINMIYLLMSGLFTPISSMPEWAAWVAELSPVKHFIVIMREVLVKGADLGAIEVPLTVLAVYAVLILGLSIRGYSKRSGG